MKNKRILNLAIASALGLFAPAAVQAFGLGKIELQSALNEPLKAEIPVTALKAGEAGNLAVRLASSSEFEKAGLDRNFILTDFSFEVVKQSASDVVIKVTSTKTVREPLLELLLTATTGKGRLIREYTILLDPPKHVLTKPTAAKTTSTKPQTPEAPKAVISEANVQPVIDSTSQTAPRTTETNQYGVTTNNDTLWNIAQKLLPADVSMNQMMLALLEVNPHAFQNNNINGLNTGQLITIPTLEQINKLTAAQAISAVQSQNDLWKNRNRSKPAAPVVTTKQQAVSAQTKSNSESTELSSAQTDAAVDANAKLSLVTPTDNDDTASDDSEAQFGNRQLTKLTEQLTLAQETIEAQAQQNIDFQSRMDAMEEQLETMRRLIALKDADLARLQSVLEDDQAQEVGLEEQVVDAVETTAENVAEFVEQQNSDESQESIAPVETGTAQEVESAPQAEADLLSPAVDGVAAAATELLGVDEATAKNFSGEVMQFIDKNKLPVSLAGVLLLVVLLLLFRRKSTTEDEPNEDATEKEIEVVAPVLENDIEETAEQEIEAVVDTVETNTSATVADVSVKTAQDLVEQADVFVGYADYAQARTALEQARFIEPNDRDIAAKLLFVLFKQDQVASFINVVEDVEFDKTSPQWFDIVQWGRSIAPEHELFSVEAEGANEIYKPQQQEPESVEEVVIDPASVELDDELENFTAADAETELSEELNEEPVQEDNESSESDNGLTFEMPEEPLDKDTTESVTEAEEAVMDDGLAFELSDDLESTSESVEITEPELEQDDDDTNTLAFEMPEEQAAESEVNAEFEEALDTPDLDFSDTDLATDIDEQDSLTVEDAAQEEIADDELSFDLDTESSDDALDLPLGDIDDELEAEAALVEIEPNEEELDLGEDFNLDDELAIDESLALELDKAEQELAADNDQTSDFTTEDTPADLEFDLGGFDDIDEAETKLDLADAYIDMGDPDGARYILEEVLADGSDEQKTRAQSLLDSI